MSDSRCSIRYPVLRSFCSLITLLFFLTCYSQNQNIESRKDASHRVGYSASMDPLKVALSTNDQVNALVRKKMEVYQAKAEKEFFVKNLLIAALLLAIFFLLIILWRSTHRFKSESQKLQHQVETERVNSKRIRLSLQQRARKSESKALRAQMNPHFIFNSLNSINYFILKNNKQKASEYLTRFSKLIRIILQNSQAAAVSLENELEALRLYLELEALRFDYHFKYAIRLEEDLDIRSTKVPPLIIQPYAENAIWHGLMHKKEEGYLDIDICKKKNFLLCKISDNGIGRRKAAEQKNGSDLLYKSVGMNITAQRIKMLQQKPRQESAVTVNDLYLSDGGAGGTEVILKIPLQYDKGYTD